MIGEREETPFPLPRLLLAFLYIGAIGFGGGMAIIAMMEQHFVRKMKLMTTEEFLHGVALGQVLGPFSVNAAIFMGYRLHGPAGAVLSAAVFMLPSVLLVIGLSWVYFTYHAVPALQKALAGLTPVVIAIILSAAWSMGRKAIRRWPAILLAAAALLAGLYKINPVFVLVASGAIGLFLRKVRLAGMDQAAGTTGPTVVNGRNRGSTFCAGLLTAQGTGGSAGIHLFPLAATFLKIGFVFFGGGFVLIPVLYQRLVGELGWLTPREFLDGLAISNLTPGPITVLATFAGYRVSGVAGALVATVALYIPAVVLMLALSHEYERFRGDSRFEDFLAGVTPAVVGLVASAAFLLGQQVLHSWQAYLVGACSLLLVTSFRWPPAAILALGALLGMTSWLP